MSYTKIRSWLQEELQGIRESGLYKAEQLIKTPQGARVDTPDGELSSWRSPASSSPRCSVSRPPR